MGLPNPFKAASDAAAALEQAKKFLELAQELQHADQDKDGKEDWKEYLEAVGRINADVAVIKEAAGRIQHEADELTKLFGEDVELIKAKLGVE